jgi:hypothetical protein
LIYRTHLPVTELLEFVVTLLTLFFQPSSNTLQRSPLVLSRLLQCPNAPLKSVFGQADLPLIALEHLVHRALLVPNVSTHRIRKRGIKVQVLLRNCPSKALALTVPVWATLLGHNAHGAALPSYKLSATTT